jgi:hypothetical protein
MDLIMESPKRSERKIRSHIATFLVELVCVALSVADIEK